SAAMLGRVVNRGGDDLAAALRALVEAEFIYQTADYPDEEYTFKHALTEEVAYRSQLARRRARTHGEVASAIAGLDEDKLDERAAVIAEYWEAGGGSLEAACWNSWAAVG